MVGGSLDMKKHPVKELKINRLLDEMFETNMELMEQIMDSNLANLFNQIVTMAQCGDDWW